MCNCACVYVYFHICVVFAHRIATGTTISNIANTKCHENPNIENYCTAVCRRRESVATGTHARLALEFHRES